MNLVLAVGGDSPTILEALRFQSAGMVVVLAALGVLAVILGALGRLFQEWKPAAPVPAKPTEAPVPESVPPEIRAVIAAAVACTVDEPHHIAEIRPAMNLWMEAWSLEGRRQIFQSHQLR